MTEDMRKRQMYLTFKEKLIKLTFDLIAELKKDFRKILRNDKEFTILNINDRMMKNENPDFRGEAIMFYQRELNLSENLEIPKLKRRSRKTKRIKKMKRVRIRFVDPFTSRNSSLNLIENYKSKSRAKQFKIFGKFYLEKELIERKSIWRFGIVQNRVLLE
jgi:hypothetical protein